MKVIVEQGDLLDALMAIIKDEDSDAAAEILRKLMKESHPVDMAGLSDGAVGRAIAHAACSPAATETIARHSPPPEELTPLLKRLEELRDGHGAVFVIAQEKAQGPEQIITHGNPPRKAQVLEATPDGRWFVKILAPGVDD